jgi:ribose transport system permease protein
MEAPSFFSVPFEHPAHQLGPISLGFYSPESHHGFLPAGYSTKAYRAMGDTYLLPSIAAVVIGGTNILGGRGRYLGTVIGVVLIVLLNSVLSIMVVPEAGRQVIYGLVIIMMLLVYGRGERVTS